MANPVLTSKGGMCMLQDDAIIALLIQRDEQALQAVSQKYGSHGRSR